jgi:hypothetical protein
MPEKLRLLSPRRAGASEIWGNQVIVTRRNGTIRNKHGRAPGDSHLLAPFSGRTLGGQIY